MKIFYIIVSVVFCALISLPIIGGLAGIENTSDENRQKNSMPTNLSFDFTEEFEDYFADNFSFRDIMVSAYSRLCVSILKTSPSSEVVVGKKGYLFSAETMEDYLRTREIDSKMLENAAKIIADASRRYEELGIELYITVAPNKNEIYSQYMPSRYIKNTLPDVYDTFKELITQNGVEFIELKQALIKNHKFALEANNLGYTYYKNDTHWNQGSLIAYNLIMDSIGHSNDKIQVNNFREVDYQGDLSGTMLGMGESGKAKAIEYYAEPKYNQSSDDYFAPMLNTNLDGGIDKHIYIFRDSFANNLVQYFSNSFEKATYDRGLPYNFERAAKEGADIVLIEVAQRAISEFMSSLEPLEQWDMDGIKAIRGENEAENAMEQEAKEEDIPEPEEFNFDELPD